jgi:SAM-dependent methyltransferase
MKFHEANRKAWDASEPYHREAVFELILYQLETQGLSCLDDFAIGALEKLGYRDKRVAQLCCNNGRELMSLVKLGASRGVGFDISEAFIKQGRELSDLSGIPCELVACDVLTIDERFSGQFDLVMITVGALGWIEDINRLFCRVADLLRPNGDLFIYEQHPLTEMLDLQAEVEAPRLTCDYFKDTPYRDTDGLDYYAGTQYDSPPAFWFVHTFSGILQSCIDEGLAITSIEEFEHDISFNWPELAESALRLPLCYQLTAKKRV